MARLLRMERKHGTKQKIYCGNTTDIASNARIICIPKTHTLLRLFIFSVLFCHVLGGPLDGKIAPTAKAIERFMQWKEENSGTAEVVSAAGKIVGGGIAGLFTAGPPGAVYGLVSGAASYATDKATDAAMDLATENIKSDRIDRIVEGYFKYTIPAVKWLDSQATDHQAATVASVLPTAVLKASKVTKYLTKLSKFSGKFSPLKSIKSSTIHRGADAFKGGYQPSQPAQPHSPSTAQSSHFSSAGRQNNAPQSFLQQGTNIFQQGGYQQGKAQQSPFGIPPSEPFGGHLNTFKRTPIDTSVRGGDITNAAAMRQMEKFGLGSFTNFVPEDDDAIECANLAYFIYKNTPEFNRVIENAKKDNVILGYIDYPAIPPAYHGICISIIDHTMTNEDRRSINNARSEGYRNFLDVLKKQLAEHNKRVDEYIDKHNKTILKIEAYNKAVEIIKDIEVFIGNARKLRDYVKKALAAFSKPTEKEYFAQSYEDINGALRQLEIIQSYKEELQDARSSSIATQVNGIGKAVIENRFLEFFRGNARSILVARYILLNLANGKFDKRIWEQSKKLISLIDKKKIAPKALAASLGNLLSGALKTYGDYNYMVARLNELANGFLILNPSLLSDAQIVCTAKGVCGIVHDWTTVIAGTKGDIANDDKWFTANDYPVNNAQALLGCIKTSGKYIGIRVISEDPEAENKTIVRLLSGGNGKLWYQKGASAAFDFLAEGHDARETVDSVTGYRFKTIVLSDGTKIIYYPATKDAEATIAISGIPAWIFGKKIELRFEQEEQKPEDFASLFAQSVTKKTSTQFEEERARFLEDVQKDIGTLSEAEKIRILEFYNEIKEAMAT